MKTLLRAEWKLVAREIMSTDGKIVKNGKEFNGLHKMENFDNLE